MASMSVATDQIERAIEKLPLDEMLTVHERLIANIHNKADADGLDSSFKSQIEKRLKEIEAGTAKGVEAFGAFSNM